MAVSDEISLRKSGGWTDTAVGLSVPTIILPETLDSIVAAVSGEMTEPCQRSRLARMAAADINRRSFGEQA